MKSLVCVAFLFLFKSCSVSGQGDKDALIKEAEEKLKNNKASVSQILTDKRYDAVHPETSFRNIIEKYCKAETISITSDTIPGKKIKVIWYRKKFRRQAGARRTCLFISYGQPWLVCGQYTAYPGIWG